ncbi:probable ATP-dependent RNA helicase DHX58 [Pelobates cultripes]|uniref:Probable ATP-dependent RNA helicase DHX58 n=1 Tax=Pelobates cultripes TaxID=61616 RepID=A0AAD1SM92_PELCU|nr:probable ATP-dependent RNA helicase DHX58 [Pelobates cultripes]
MELRDYQWEVIKPALEGKNIIIWLPTGSGKTRAALYVAMRHLETKRNAKVAMIVNKVHLVHQHYEKEFKPFLQDRFKVIEISGDNEEKCFFANFVKKNDVIICTAQILQNALIHESEEKYVKLTDFTLLIIDECHHTHKDGVYNRLMESYIEKNLSKEGNLPQILGLTASPGTGRANSFEKAVDHILQICANLDTWKIMSPKNQTSDPVAISKQPKKQYDLVSERTLDPFGNMLKELMRRIHDYLDKTNCVYPEFGTQTYEQKIVELEKEGTEEFNKKKRTCALHLRKYNDSLFTHDTVRMIDAFQLLDSFYKQEKAIRTLPDPTEHLLFQLFDDNCAKLLELAEDVRFENPKLSRLEEILKDHFQFSSESRGIIFTRTRQSTHNLHDWMVANKALQNIGIKAASLTGAGHSNQTKHMTQNKQQEVIQSFRKGHLNLIISTSVAEEGLDIPQCNIVVRYGLMTNETAMIQARGRARAEESCYSFLAKKGSKEMRREITNESLEDLMKRAIKHVQNMTEREYEQKLIHNMEKETQISADQMQAMINAAVAASLEKAMALVLPMASDTLKPPGKSSRPRDESGDSDDSSPERQRPTKRHWKGEGSRKAPKKDKAPLKRQAPITPVPTTFPTFCKLLQT